MIRKTKREIAEFHRFFKEGIKSTQYKNYQNEKIDGIRKKEIEDFENVVVPSITFFDVLTNHDVTKLVKKLYALNKKQFLTHHNYKKANLFKKYTYVHMKAGYSESGIFDEIEFKDDIYLKSITIYWSQISNYYGFFEYKIRFKKSLTYDDIKNFIDDNIGCFTSKDMIYLYKKSEDDFSNNLLFDEYLDTRFIEICQHYITSLLYSRYAKWYSLPYLINYVVPHEYNFLNFAKETLGDCLYNLNNNLLFISNISRTSYSLYSDNGKIPGQLITSYISKYKLAFYYRFFGPYELVLLNTEFSQFSSQNKRVNYKYLIDLLNRFQGIKEEQDLSNQLNEDLSKEWILLRSGDVVKHSFKIDNYKRIFENSFSYFKTTIEFYSAHTNKMISIAALVAAILGVIVAFIAILI